MHDVLCCRKVNAGDGLKKESLAKSWLYWVGESRLEASCMGYPMEERHCKPLCLNWTPVSFPNWDSNVHVDIWCPNKLCGCSPLCDGAEEPMGPQLMAVLVLLTALGRRSLWSYHTSSLQLSLPHLPRNITDLASKPWKSSQFADQGILLPCLCSN